MQVSIIIHQIYEQDTEPTIQIIGTYQNSKEALENFNYYLDSLEKEWILNGEAKAFNRFSEPQDSTLAYASCNEHSIYVFEEELL